MRQEAPICWVGARGAGARSLLLRGDGAAPLAFAGRGPKSHFGGMHDRFLVVLSPAPERPIVPGSLGSGILPRPALCT